jgi:hypothetical protein
MDHGKHKQQKMPKKKKHMMSKDDMEKMMGGTMKKPKGKRKGK